MSAKASVTPVSGGITVFGINNWDWGTSGYNFQSEGWFGTDTKYGGMDKLGHAYTGYVVSQYFSQRIAHSVDDPTNAYKHSTCLINVPYNHRCYNDGYHIVHHLHGNMHWSEMPDHFQKNIDEYVKNDAIVFSGLGNNQTGVQVGVRHAF